MNREWLIKAFGNSWYTSIRTFLESRDFQRLGNQVAALRKTRAVYPDSTNIFRAFRETPFEDVKVVLYGQDPFPKEGYADGLLFSNSLLMTEMSRAKSLDYILQEVDNCYPEWKDTISHGRLDMNDLLRWAKQGVLLINRTYTVEEGKPNSHLYMWDEFSRVVIGALNTKQDLVQCFFGNTAQELQKYVTNKTHTVLSVVHPAAEAYRPNAGFLGSGVFKTINDELLLRNKEIIYW